jgi:hypothetical protein
MDSHGKLARLVDDFVATARQHGSTVTAAAVAEQLEARIGVIADQVGVSPQTVLDTYIGEDWGRKLALQMIGDRAGQAEDLAATSAEHLALPVAGRLVAALGQATLYASINRNGAHKVGPMDLRQAAEAVAGLGLAIAHCPPGQSLVLLPAGIVAGTRLTLLALRDHLRAADWSFCPCGESHGQEVTDAAVLAAVETDLLLLPPVPPR